MKNRFYFLTALCTFLAAGAFATTYTVTVADFSFTPANVNAHVGDVINWVWSSGSHTTTSTTIPSGATAWDHAMTSTSTSFSYTITQVGTYNYKCTPHAASGMLGTITVTGTTGVAATNAEQALSVYPNPANNFINLDLKAMTGTVAVQVFDAAGRIVLNNSFDGGQPARVATTSLPAGLYRVRALNANVMSSASFTVVKQ